MQADEAGGTRHQRRHRYAAPVAIRSRRRIVG
jgi:hypothetical protein